MKNIKMIGLWFWILLSLSTTLTCADSWDDNYDSDYNAVSAQLKSLMDEDTQIYWVNGLVENDECTISIDENDHSVVLILSNNRIKRWIIENPNDIEVKAVVVSEDQQVQLDGVGARVFQVKELMNTEDDFNEYWSYIWGCCQSDGFVTYVEDDYDYEDVFTMTEKLTGRTLDGYANVYGYQNGIRTVPTERFDVSNVGSVKKIVQRINFQKKLEYHCYDNYYQNDSLNEPYLKKGMTLGDYLGVKDTALLNKFTAYYLDQNDLCRVIASEEMDYPYLHGEISSIIEEPISKDEFKNFTGKSDYEDDSIQYIEGLYREIDPNQYIKGIYRKNLAVYWVGKIEMAESAEKIIEIDAWSDKHSRYGCFIDNVKVYIDGNLLYDNNVRRQMIYNFEEGEHLVEVEYYESYGEHLNDPTPFCVQIKAIDNEHWESTLDSQELLDAFAENELLGEKIVVFDVTGSSRTDGKVFVNIEEQKEPIHLILNSADPVNWIIDSESLDNVKTLYYSSEHKGSRVSTQDELSIFVKEDGEQIKALYDQWYLHNGVLNAEWPSEMTLEVDEGYEINLVSQLSYPYEEEEEEEQPEGSIMFVIGDYVEPAPLRQGNVDSKGVVSFKDPYLERHIRIQLDKRFGDITLDDMSSIRDLSIGENEWVRSLEDLKYCTNLEKLVILSVNTRSLKGIENLSKLYVLNVAHSEDIDDFVFVLSRKESLEHLHIGGAPKGFDLYQLKGLINLKSFSINAPIEDLSFIREMTSLENLNIRFLNTFEDLSFIRPLLNLKRININGFNALTTSDDIESLKQLESIIIEDSAPIEIHQDVFENLKYLLIE